MKKLSYEQAVEYILSTPKFTKKNPVKNSKALLAELGNPQEKTKVIHIAGTNGKGSVCAFLGSIFKEAGRTYGMFTSPHLVEINERFRISGSMVSNEKFTAAFNRVMEAVEGIVDKGYQHPTFFELLFTMAMVIFEEEKVEYAIIETGIGGRTDATNAVESPVLTIITTIGLDHTEVLGDTIEKIAFEKAGIIKPGVPVIFDGTDETAARVIEETAEKNHCRFYKYIEKSTSDLSKEEEFYHEIIEFGYKNIDFLFKYGYYGYVRVSLTTIGTYQIKNASLAIRAIQVLDEGIRERAIVEGVRLTKWQGRMDMVMPKVYLDGAHNANGIAEFIKTVKHFKDSRKVLLFSAVIEKDYRQMIKEICEKLQFDAIVVTRLPSNRAIPLEILREEFEKSTGCNIYAIEDVREAFNQTLQLKGEDGVAFCAGSLYLVGEIIGIIRRIKHD
ncbi:bifunctional folylpolyglutamate synthase/dihydrofolate synthase [Konateibacter massiliensis]|uniref:bifunctional folylpolyglutamate synthase/dihydrofolate synthase n=1 Tax=Konateibacter massiliensis TaxID=2002841 RepID=UPI000C154944|nr:folylpolyglutamate synthase/dihydrofolate synthase family protein [Konateibacter massiliensis]